MKKEQVLKELDKFRADLTSFLGSIPPDLQMTLNEIKEYIIKA